MKFRKWFIPIVVLSISLVSCASTKGNSNSTNPSQASMSLPEQLLIGTLKLEGTNLAIGKTEATNLLPLWQAYKELLSNNNTAKEELDAVISQIQSTMTKEQLKAITDMKLTFKDIASTMTALGITFTRPNASGTQIAPNGGNFQQGFGGFPGEGGGPSGSGTNPGGPNRPSGNTTGGNTSGGGTGGFPGAGGFSAQNLSQSQIATLQAARGNNPNREGRIPSPLMNALIDLLQKRSQTQ
jgi:hypothetical protein